MIYVGKLNLDLADLVTMAFKTLEVISRGDFLLMFDFFNVYIFICQFLFYEHEQ